MLIQRRSREGAAATAHHYAEQAATLAPLVLVFISLTAFGANSRWLSTLATVGNFATALLVMVAVGRNAPVGAARIAWVAVPFGLSMACILFPNPPGGLGTPDEAMAGMSYLCGLAALTGAGMAIASSPRRRALFGDGLLALCVAYLATAMTARAIDIHRVWGYEPIGKTGRFTGTMLNANAAACVFGMITLIGFGQLRGLLAGGYLPAARAGTQMRAALATLCVFVGLGSCAITQSRFGLFVTLLIMLVQGVGDLRSMTLRLSRSALAILIVLPVALFGAGFGAATLARTTELVADGYSRLAAYQALARLSVERPWVGFGLGSFTRINAERMPMTLLKTTWNWGSAHNIVLDAALTGGWPFTMLLATSLIALQFGGGSRRMRSSCDGARQGVSAAIFLVVAFAMFDIALTVPAIASFFALLTGTAWGARPRNRAPAAEVPSRR